MASIVQNDEDPEHASVAQKDYQEHCEPTIKPSVAEVKNKKRQSVQFSSELVTSTHLMATAYDRSAVPSDIFSCDVCGARIPCGIRGFEPYGTCLKCEDGFDLCGSCCGVSRIMKLCGQKFQPNAKPATLIVKKRHQHRLTVIDRTAQVQWANDGIVDDLSAGEKILNKTSETISKTKRKSPSKPSPSKKNKSKV